MKQCSQPSATYFKLTPSVCWLFAYTAKKEQEKKKKEVISISFVLTQVYNKIMNIIFFRIILEKSGKNLHAIFQGVFFCCCWNEPVGGVESMVLQVVGVLSTMWCK